MKVYISADIEGVTGITHWDETDKNKPDYKYFSDQMTDEVAAACKGALEAGADEIFVMDAHGSARNIDFSKLPENVKIIRGWAMEPFMMVQGIDKTFDAFIMIGYHSPGSSGQNPLSHTMSTGFNYVKMNGEIVSEFIINSYAASYAGVPTVFLSGDSGLCKTANKLNSKIVTVAVNSGLGGSVTSIHPKIALEKIKKGVKKALLLKKSEMKLKLPDKFKFEISYKNHCDAYKFSFYPGVKKISDTILSFETRDYFDFLRFLLFNF